MSILQNAIDSIELGVEDYQSNQPKRVISSVRNFYAGILLLFKYKLALLSQDSDESLLKQQIVPVEEDGKIVWKGKGKKTVDFWQIQERFGSLGIEVDWKQLQKAQDYRNNIEHYYDLKKTKQETVRQYISGCFIIICDFIRNYLSEDPKGLFSQDTWEIMVAERAVYEAEKKACTDALEQLEWTTDTTLRIVEDYICTDCSSGLIQPSDTSPKDASECFFQCRTCDAEWDFEELLSSACEKEAESDHERIRHGGEPTFAYCPGCEGDYYNTDEKVCVQCGAEGPYTCDVCGTIIPLEELTVNNGKLCGYCFHKFDKDE